MMTLPSGVGSRLVPKHEEVQAFFVTVTARVETFELSDPVACCRAQNLYAAYVALALLWGLGHRPRKEPIVTRSTLRSLQRWIVVADKHNCFREPRIVPVCDTLWDLLLASDYGLEQLCAYLGSEGFPVARAGDHLLVRLSPTGRARPLGSADIPVILAREGLAYPWKSNAARHYWISESLRRGWPLANVEPFIGHIHDGREPWGVFSLAELPQMGAIFRAYAEEILARLGVRVLPHPAERLLR